MRYKLKKGENEFEVTREGGFEYHHFRHGVTYDRVPEEELSRFEKIEDPAIRKPASTEVSGGRRGEKK